MLSRARTTSSAVENCWRTPPIARDVEPLTSLAALGDDDVVGAEEREVVGHARADRTGACDDYPGHSRTMRSTSSRSVSFRSRSGGRTPPRTGTPRRPSTIFEAAWNGSACNDGAQRTHARAVLRRRVAHERDDRVGEAGREPGDGAGRARARVPCGMSASGPTKMSRPSTR